MRKPEGESSKVKVAGFAPMLRVYVLATCAHLGPHKMVAFFEGARARQEQARGRPGEKVNLAK